MIQYAHVKMFVVALIFYLDELLALSAFETRTGGNDTEDMEGKMLGQRLLFSQLQLSFPIITMNIPFMYTLTNPIRLLSHSSTHNSNSSLLWGKSPLS